MSTPAIDPAGGQPPTCSICIANYNGETMLADCLGSVFSQNPSITTEVIVHDDASTDASLAVLAGYPRVIVIASRENVGFCVANNRMVARARGEYVLLLNNDAALDADGLHELLEAAQAQAPKGILTLPQRDWKSGQPVDAGCLLDPFYNPVPNLRGDRRDVAMVIGACLFLPRSLWIELGGFPEWFESIGEDLYLCCLARLRGLPVQVTAASGYRHRQGASFSGERAGDALQSTFRRRSLSERNKTTVMFICTPTWIVWPLLALHVVSLCVEGFVLLLVRRDPRIWREIYAQAIAHPFRDRANLRSARRRAQSLREISLARYLAAFTLLPDKLRLLLRRGVPTIR